jgi:hypothetical protein
VRFSVKTYQEASDYCVAIARHNARPFIATQSGFEELEEGLQRLAVKFEFCLRMFNVFLPNHNEHCVSISPDVVQIFFDSSNKKIPFVYIEEDVIKVYFYHESFVFLDTSHPVVFDNAMDAARFVLCEMMKYGWQHKQ